MISVIQLYKSAVPIKYDSAAEIVYKFLYALKWKVTWMRNILRMCDGFHWVQDKLVNQLVFNNFRYEYVADLWRREVLEYCTALRASVATGNYPQNALLLKQIPKIKEELVEKLLRLYMYRCKFKHAFAYC